MSPIAVFFNRPYPSANGVSHPVSALDSKFESSKYSMKHPAPSGRGISPDASQ
jgi:hypothetical protein